MFNVQVLGRDYLDLYAYLEYFLASCRGLIKALDGWWVDFEDVEGNSALTGGGSLYLQCMNLRARKRSDTVWQYASNLSGVAKNPVNALDGEFTIFDGVGKIICTFAAVA